MGFKPKKKTVTKKVPTEEDITEKKSLKNLQEEAEKEIEEVKEEIEQPVEEEEPVEEITEPEYNSIQVVDKLPVQEVRYQKLEDGSVVKFVTIEESLTELMNTIE